MVASSLNIVQTTAVLYVGQDVYVDELKHVKLKPGRALQKDELSNKDLTIVLLGIAENVNWEEGEITCLGNTYILKELAWNAV